MIDVSPRSMVDAVDSDEAVVDVDVDEDAAGDVAGDVTGIDLDEEEETFWIGIINIMNG